MMTKQETDLISDLIEDMTDGAIVRSLLCNVTTVSGTTRHGWKVSAVLGLGNDIQVRVKEPNVAAIHLSTPSLQTARRFLGTVSREQNRLDMMEQVT
jgi:hypothetical protein